MKPPENKIRLMLGLFLLFLPLTAVDARAQKPNLIGFIKQKTDRSFGCYLTSPAEYDKKAAVRRYYFIDDELGGTMNIGGKDVSIEMADSKEIKSVAAKKRFLWTFHTQQINATFTLTATKTANEGADVFYDALLSVSKGNLKQTVRAKGFCGG